MNRKRNTKRDRRPSLRRPIPPGSATPARAGLLRMPVYEQSPLMGMLVEVPIDLVPLYAVLAGMHQLMSGQPAGSCVTTCHEIVGALGHLGFSAEPMAACATVFRSEGRVSYADVGVWETPPIVRPDNTTNGHMVVWAGSFNRMVDATVVQDPTLLKLARREIRFTLPVVLPVPGGRSALLDGSTPATPRGPFVVSWKMLPEWTDTMAPILQGSLGELVDRAGLALAYDALETIRVTGRLRDISDLPDLYPTLGHLLEGRASLPPLLEQPDNGQPQP